MQSPNHSPPTTTRSPRIRIFAWDIAMRQRPVREKRKRKKQKEWEKLWTGLDARHSQKWCHQKAVGGFYRARCVGLPPTKRKSNNQTRANTVGSWAVSTANKPAMNGVCSESFEVSFPQEWRPGPNFKTVTTKEIIWRNYNSRQSLWVFYFFMPTFFCCSVIGVNPTTSAEHR